MKKSLLILLLFSSLTVFAQKNKRDHIKALKVAYITEKLDLTSKEAQGFWPVYNTYEDKTNQIKHEEIRKIRREIKSNFESMTDAEAKALITNLNDAEIKLHQLRMDFANDLLDILPPKKIILLKVSEEEFKRKMFEEYKKRRKEKP
ncbi:sensor of ECF-type sigma factor [Tamlana haliotis]|uniref:Sensor of ECF-type sigma factor n=1 Tax=Pseudotamlana haliotis TaxID=2614804 RepID=A0A6N6MHN9_9FLAO|nr:sensor of ECF-type sigma factor [Tamlana haliotis]KAB1069409.1 sensor of ECF-type sigma factor [Tamlana haliotis]